MKSKRYKNLIKNIKEVNSKPIKDLIPEIKKNYMWLGKKVYNFVFLMGV